jgi:hypothetical protein
MHGRASGSAKKSFFQGFDYLIHEELWLREQDSNLRPGD